MAGYLKTPEHRVFNGRMKFYNATASAKVQNGSLLTIKDGESLQYIASADTTAKLRCIGIEDMMGKKGYVFRFEVPGTAEYWLVENQEYFFDHIANANVAEVEVGVGEFVRAHHLEIGEEFVTDRVTGTIAVGTQYGVKTDGTIG